MMYLLYSVTLEPFDVDRTANDTMPWGNLLSGVPCRAGYHAVCDTTLSGYRVKCASDSVDLLTTSLELRPQHLVLAPVREQAPCNRSNSYARSHRFGSTADAL